VIDKDRWPEENLKKVASVSLKMNVILAVSVPCFELWLLLHHSDPTPDMESMSSKRIKQRLGKLLGGYNESNLRTEQFQPHVEVAVERVIQMDTSQSERWPSRPGTRVYRVIQSIQERM